MGRQPLNRPAARGRADHKGGAGAIGEGRCGGAPCVKVLVVEMTPELVERIGVVIEGYKVEVVETGEIRALDSD